jgi:Uma2 family endonuclease
MNPVSAVAIHTRIGPRSAGITMTPEEFDALDPEAFDDNFRYELINGVLIVSPYPGIGERDPNEELGHILRSYQEAHPQGSALDLTINEQTVPANANRRRADRVLWVGLGRTSDDEQDIPAVIVEFVSARRRDWLRDYEQKRAEYLAAGVREYWIIDRYRRILTVHRQGPSGAVTLIIKENETYQTDLLPGFVLPLARLLAKADQWSKKSRRRRPPAPGAER